MRLEQRQNTYDDGNIPEIDTPKDFAPMKVSIPAPYSINSANQSQTAAPADNSISQGNAKKEADTSCQKK